MLSRQRKSPLKPLSEKCVVEDLAASKVSSFGNCTFINKE
jgi:hypothetical protein